MEDVKKKKRVLINIFLTITMISVIANFVITLLFTNNKNLLIDSASSLILCVFTVFFIFSAISNRRKHKNYIVISSLLLTVFSLFSISSNLNLLKKFELPNVDDFTNKSLVDVIKWSEKNKIDIDQVYEYSDTVDEYKIINQSITPGTILKNTKKLTVTVSEGPDPDKEVIIPDMESWNADRVLKYVLKNNLGNVKVEFIESDKNKDTLIEQSKSGNIRRSDELNLKFSIGDQPLEKTKLMNLSKKNLFEAEFYLKRNGINYEVKKQFSNKINRNYVIKTDKSPGSMINPNDDKIVLTASKGKKIKVPNLKKYDMLKVTEWVIKNKLKLEFVSKYDEKIKANKVISANYKSGDIIEQKTLIKVVVSKGRLVMKDFDSIDEFRNWANKYNINYEEKFEFSNDIEEGKIISFSHKTGDTIKNDDIITVTISDGKKTKIPNVVGDTKTEAIKKLENAKIKYNFVYDYSTKDKNIVIKQSLSAGNEVGQNTTITLTLSNGKKAPEKSYSKSSSKANTNTNSGGNNPTPKKDTCISKTYTVSRELNNIFRNNTGYSNVKSKIESYFASNYPGVKISVTSAPETGLTSGSYVSGNAGPGASVTSCNGIVYSIKLAQ